MKYINVDSNRGLVNLFADYIVTEINKFGNIDSIIEVTDCEKFFVVNGYTSYYEPLNLIEIKENFIKTYTDLISKNNRENFNVIDLIQYGYELNKHNIRWFNFYNSERPIYHKNLINSLKNIEKFKYSSISFIDGCQYELNQLDKFDTYPQFLDFSPINISSEFPHGYSLSMGRGLLYYGEYISYQIFDSIYANNIKIKLTTILDEGEDYDIEIISDSIFTDETIKSMVLDTFDFDIESFNLDLKEYDLMKDLLEPFERKIWLKRDKLINIF